jgi:hypothetical protein
MRRFRPAHRKPTGAIPRTRGAGDVNADVREAVTRDGYSLFRIGLLLSDIPKSG